MTSFDSLAAQLQARWPEHRVAPSLGRISRLMELLGDPQRSAPVIQIAGTNGKGSTAIIIDALLRSSGLRTGRFSSPHLVSVTERICLDGRPIAREDFVRVWDEIEPMVAMVDAERIDGVAMTFFEVITGMAYAAFADAPVDVMVIETGLGGTWDATNVAEGQVAVITPIGLDHTHLLGETLAEIAGEKAGIIKPGAAAILAGQEPEAARVLLERCTEVGALPQREGIDFGVLERAVAVGGQVLRLNTFEGPKGDLHLPAHGAFQAQNAAVALAAVETFLGMKPLTAEVIDDGFADVRTPGRLELARTSPPVILDGAHNPAGAAASVEGLAEAFTLDPVIGVLAVMRDKDVEGVLRAWEPVLQRIVCTQPAGTDRALPADELAELASGIFGADRVVAQPRLDLAIEHAVMLADLAGAGTPGVVVTGSVIAVGEARALLVGADEERPGELGTVVTGDDLDVDDLEGAEPLDLDELIARGLGPRGEGEDA